MAANISALCLSFIFFFTLLSIFPSSITSLTFSLSRFHTNTSRDSYQNLNSLVSSSLTRAFHLKNPPTKTTTTTTTTKLSSHSYGGYSISLSFGTPPQIIPLILDTGSDLVWFPCTNHYQCKNCFTSKIPSFIPEQSSSSELLGCQSPKCSWIHHKSVQCRDCNDEPLATSKNCTQICPSYLVLYGSGLTGGIALLETLNLPNRIIPNFLVGCSVLSYRQPAGIAGFGRGKNSLPSQLNLDKFSYCLLSHKFDDTTRTSSLILDNGRSDSDKKTTGLTYTPFVNNPSVVERNAFSVYYYVRLRRITVGGRRVKVPHKYLSPDSDGNGGTIVDSGTTFTFMAPELFEPLAEEFVSQMVEKRNYTRGLGVEASTGLRPCFDVSGEKTASFPELKLHFKGGAAVTLPVENYFAVVGEGSAVCLTVVSGREAHGGPAIILGNYQMQNYYVEYDLRNQRLGFKQQLCK